MLATCDPNLLFPVLQDKSHHLQLNGKKNFFFFQFFLQNGTTDPVYIPFQKEIKHNPLAPDHISTTNPKI